jgi:hypothetical protein
LTKTKALLRSDRQDQVILWFSIRMERGVDVYCSLNEIARGLGLAPSTKLRKMVEEIVPSRLEKTELQRQGRWKGFGYRLARGTFEYPKKKERQITVNHRGNSLQLEMWK